MWEARQGRSPQRTWASEGPGTPQAHVLGPSLLGPRSLGAFGSQGHERRGPTQRQRPWSLLWLRGRPVGPQESAKRCGSPEPRRRTRRVPGLPGTPGIRNWAPSGAPVLGLERPRTLRDPSRIPTTLAGLQEPRQPRIVEEETSTLCAGLPTIAKGSRGHAMCPRSTVPLVTLGNLENTTFPAFPFFFGFFGDSGGPSLPSGSVLRGMSKVARMATLRLFDPGWTVGTLASWLARVAQRPYSWPPE